MPPVIIFKGKPDKNKEKRYNNLDVVKNRRILIFFQNNAWVNDAIFKKWLDSVYLEYEIKLNKKCLLIMGKAPSHITKNILSYIKDKEVEYTFIPSKLTRFLQQLDIGINFPFKAHLKNKYMVNEANKITNTEEVNPIKFNDNLTISNIDKLRLNLIYWTLLIWEKDDTIKKSTIIASFNKSTISYPLDGSNDNNFEMPDEIVDQHNNE